MKAATAINRSRVADQRASATPTRETWYWHLLEPELRGRGHDVVAVDLTADDDSVGLAAYADAVVKAIGDRFFPADLQHRVERELLGITTDEMAGGHLLARARPDEVADPLGAYHGHVANVRNVLPGSR